MLQSYSSLTISVFIGFLHCTNPYICSIDVNQDSSLLCNSSICNNQTYLSGTDNYTAQSSYKQTIFIVDKEDLVSCEIEKGQPESTAVPNNHVTRITIPYTEQAHPNEVNGTTDTAESNNKSYDLMKSKHACCTKEFVAEQSTSKQSYCSENQRKSSLLTNLFELKHTKKEDQNMKFFNNFFSLLQNIFYFREDLMMFFTLIEEKLRDANDKYTPSTSKNKKVLKNTNEANAYDNTHYKIIELALAYLSCNEDELEDPLIMSDNEYKQLKNDEKNLTAIFSVQQADGKDFLLCEEIRNIKNYNHLLLSGVEQQIMKSKISPLMQHLNKTLGKGFGAARHYDMIMFLIKPLYRISTYINNNVNSSLKTEILSSPLSYKAHLYGNSFSSQHEIFYWAFDWLYYFSNIYKILKDSLYSSEIFCLINEQTEIFVVQCIILAYIAIHKETNTIDLNELNPTVIKQWKENILVKLAHKNTTSAFSYLEEFILKIMYKTKKSRSPLIISKNRHLKSLRITRSRKEHALHAETLFESLFPFVYCLYSLGENSFPRQQVN